MGAVSIGRKAADMYHFMKLLGRQYRKCLELCPVGDGFWEGGGEEKGVVTKEAIGHFSVIE